MKTLADSLRKRGFGMKKPGMPAPKGPAGTPETVPPDRDLRSTPPDSPSPISRMAGQLRARMKGY